jgi:protein SCO1
MRPVQKVLTTLLWACAVVAMVSVIGANMWRGRAGTLPPQHESADEHLPVLAEVPAFALVDQNHAPVTLQTLHGKPFIANFIFTNCAGPCPVMTAKMASLQKTVPAGVKLVSVSVDPRKDTPAVLKEYAQGFRADDARWHFLTAAKPQEADAVFALARGMLLAAHPATADAPILHSEKFVLVDGDGKIRGYYGSGDATEMDRLKADAAELAGAKGT